MSTREPPSVKEPEGVGGALGPVIFSFDVEEHHRIEAASGLDIPADAQALYADRAEASTRMLLDLLAEHRVAATFYIVGEFAAKRVRLVRDIAEAGHEVASHSWDHRRVLTMTPDEFRADLDRSKKTLEDISGSAVVGYRAPTFSITRKTPWAPDVLADAGFLYDSSIYPVRHDRYGIPDAPRGPFLVRGREREILEIPPAILRIGRYRLPAGGGGYFRLFPPFVIRRAIAQSLREVDPPVAMLYFHPWEFDPDQPRLPLGRISRVRTYAGQGPGQLRLSQLLGLHTGHSRRADGAARRLTSQVKPLIVFSIF